MYMCDIIIMGDDNMPATNTHHFFTKDVFKVININVNKKISDSVDIFNLFGKSFDILFFSNMNLGNKAHNYNSNLYFQNMIKYIRNNNLYNNSQALAYLYGSICHYVLDSTIHPYVFYYTGRVKTNDKSTYKYRGLHTYFEYMIDAILFKERNNKDIYKSNLTKEVFPKVKFSNDLLNMIDYVYLQTFNYNKGAHSIIKGTRNFRLVFKYIMCSRFGLKKIFYRFIDFFRINKTDRLKYYSYHIRKLDMNVLNLNHEKWYYPVDKKINYHYSFYDLYDISIEKARKLINELDNALDKDEKTVNKVLREIGNLSYKTGKSINKKDEMKYFAF